MALDTTIGGANADSWADVAYADAFHAGSPHAAAWEGADLAQKEWALRMAARLMGLNIPWQGSAASETQALAFPRTGLLTRYGFPLSSLINPKELKDAQSEFAKQLLESNRLEDNEAVRQGLTQLKVGSIDLKWRDDYEWNKDTAPVISDAVLSLLVESWWKTAEEIWLFKVV